MNDMLELLTSAHSGPVWAVFAVAVTQVANVFYGGRKAKVDDVTAATQAHANLNKSLQQSFDVMAKELERLRRDHETEIAELHKRYQDRIEALERELARMRFHVLGEGVE